MKPFIKWAGGKSKELSRIKENLPDFTGRYIEPFVGAGAVYLGLMREPALVNDLSEELIRLYQCIRQGDREFFCSVSSLYGDFRSIDSLIGDNAKAVLSLCSGELSADGFIGSLSERLLRIGRTAPELFMLQVRRNIDLKLSRMERLMQVSPLPDKDRLDNIESALKSAYYMTVRQLYYSRTGTEGFKAAVFYFVREYCYSSMFRYNKAGQFNVPYGGISYNRKDLAEKIKYLGAKELKEYLGRTAFFCMDFEAFLNKIDPAGNDLIFLDPPYDSEFSTYSQNPFDQDCQKRLCSYLCGTKAYFMLVIKDTPFIRKLYKNNFHILEYDKQYMVSFKNRNDRRVSHLMITNY